MILFIIGSACGASNTTNGSSNSTVNSITGSVTLHANSTAAGFIPKPDGAHPQHGATGNQNTIVTSNSGTSGLLSNIAASNVAFTTVPSNGTSVDNTKKIAVYMPSVTNPMYFETTSTSGNIAVAYDPMTTAMFFEYNPDYLGDSTIGSKLITANYALLIVPMSQMSTNAATAITNYINSGGSVWFLNDPCMTTAGDASVQLTSILGAGVAGSTSSSTSITVVNYDDITNGLPASFKPVGATAKSAEFRQLSGSGSLGALNYKVLMSSGTNAMLVKFENPSNGARVIYSDPNMFISGGTASYFNSAISTQLFTQTKAWMLKLATNPNGVSVTYPNTDKQLTVSCDDEECTSYDVKITPMINAETSLGISPAAVNTFFIIPNVDMVSGSASTYGINYYARYGDTHNLHPHVTLSGSTWADSHWDSSSVSTATDDTYLANLKTFVNGLMKTSNYGYYSFRFPMTTFCENSMKAVSDSGFTIDSSANCDGAAGGSPVDNTYLFPMQVLVNNVKTNIIEHELPADFDINYATGTAFAAGYNAYSSQFKNGNFPMDFVVAGHYQGMGTNCGVPGWGVTSTGLTSGLTTILNTQKAANPNYINFNTLANYINGVRSATIKATNDGAGTTTVTVTNSKAITAFTLKIGVGSAKSVTCDGAQLTIKTDSTTGAKYVTKDLTAGTHTFKIVNSIAPATQPTVKFTANATTINSGGVVNFVATVTGNPTPTVSWNFGDGSQTVTGTSVSHTFVNTGTTAVNRTVVANASNSAGYATYSGNVTVNPATTAPTAPTLIIAPTTSTITSGGSVAFTATITGNPTPTVSWNFGDGSAPINGTSVSHTFTTGINATTYTVNATASNGINPAAVKTASVLVNPSSSGGAPVASFTQTATGGSSPEVVTFTSTSTNNPTCSWNFGDGINATGNTVTHAFVENDGTKTFTVTLTATNNAGTSTKTGTVQVTPYVNPPSGAPAAWFVQSVSSGTTSTTFTFTPECDGNPIQLVWDFRDGTTQITTSQTAVTHKFAKAGKYDVTLVASNSAGKDYDDHSVTVS
jgi:PKD repeat protein